ncbi:MAG: hypothetical protein VX738_11600, partial [Planctomycetota bacterium]|nr:hypothetical protein [Planctomycetota bacterium]
PPKPQPAIRHREQFQHLLCLSESTSRKNLELLRSFQFSIMDDSFVQQTVIMRYSDPSRMLY